MKNEKRLKQVQQVQCTVPASMSCILLCETRAKVCCKTGSMRPLLGGAAGSNLPALAETTRHRKHTGTAISLVYRSIYHINWCRISSTNSSVRFEIWDQGNKPKCPLPGTRHIHAHCTKIILRNLSISNRWVLLSSKIVVLCPLILCCLNLLLVALLKPFESLNSL